MEKLLRALLAFIVFVAIASFFFAMNACAVRYCTPAAITQVRVAKISETDYMVGQQQRTQVSLRKLEDQPYYEIGSDGFAHLTCYVPFDMTNYHYVLGEPGLRYNGIWPDGSCISRGGMLYYNEQFYRVDYRDPMNAAIRQHQEECELSGEIFATRGALIDIDASVSADSDLWLGRLVLNLLFIFTCAGANLITAEAILACIFSSAIVMTYLLMMRLKSKNKMAAT